MNPTVNKYFQILFILKIKITLIYCKGIKRFTSTCELQTITDQSTTTRMGRSIRRVFKAEWALTAAGSAPSLTHTHTPESAFGSLLLLLLVIIAVRKEH